MTTATAEKPAPAVAVPVAAPIPARKSDRKIILGGFDLGTNKSCILAGPAGSNDVAVSKIVPTVVGYVKEGIVDGIIGGKPRMLELGETIGRSCNALLDQFYPALTTLIARASSDSVVQLLQNIIITGGGSQIRGIDTVLQKRLEDDGFESPKVRLAGQDYKRYVALGAHKAARAARENQWQHVLD